MDSLKRTWARLFASPRANALLRCAVMLAGIALIACGIALAKHSCTGTSPISSLPAVLTEVSERMGCSFLTMGLWTFVFNAAFFLAEVALLRSRFALVQLLQIPLFAILAIAVDLWLSLLSAFPLDGYGPSLACLLLSVAVLGLGIRVQLASGLLMTPGDAIVQVISYVARKPFPACKVAWDASLMATAACVSLVALGGLFQVREGTLISAALVGVAVGAWGRALAPLRGLIPSQERCLITPLVPDEVPQAARS